MKGGGVSTSKSKIRKEIVAITIPLMKIGQGISMSKCSRFEYRNSISHKSFNM